MFRVLGGLAGALAGAGAMLVYWDATSSPHGSSFVLGQTANLSLAYLDGFHETVVTGAVDEFYAAMRDPTVGLLTVANHGSVIDDPVLVSAITPRDVLTNPRQMRTVLCAAEICFGNFLTSAYFALGKALPVVRGGGTRQASLQTCADVLASGSWVHVFPEGKVVQDVPLDLIRHGAGRIAVDAAHREGRSADNIVLIPFYHRGMQAVKPKGKGFATDKVRIHVIVGRPIPLLPQDTSKTSVSHVSRLIETSLRELEAEMEEIYPFEQVRQPPKKKKKREEEEEEEEKTVRSGPATSETGGPSTSASAP